MLKIDTKLNDEAGRLLALRRYEVLDTPPEAPFDKVTSLVEAVLNVPIAIIALVDANRQWFKSCIGLTSRETARDISFCTHTITSRQPLIVPDARLDSRFAENPLVTGSPFIVSYAGMPLQTPDGYNIGSLCVIDTIPRQFDPEQIAMLKTFADVVVDEFEMRRLSQTDPLTGAVSRLAFLGEVERAVARYCRHLRPSSLVMFDIDHFKDVNDTHGHHLGDDVLHAIGGAITRIVRPADTFGRLGGEEFAVLLAESELEEAVVAARRYRAAIEELVIAHDPPVRVTASFGVAALEPDCRAAELWMERADALLYGAKHTGRNRVCF